MNSELPPEIRDRIRAAVVSGNKIGAIKLLRDQRPDLGLAEAKDIIDHWESGGEAALTNPQIPFSDPEIERLLYKGEKIPAIKCYRESHEVGLAEAKAAVEAIEADLRAKHPDRFINVRKPSGCLTLLTTLAALLVSCLIL